MADYKTMYHRMFNAVTDAERRLHQATAVLRTAQRECEEMFMEADGKAVSLPKREEE